MVFVDGEGVPSPAPPGVISPRSGVWNDAGEGRDLGRHPGRGRSAGGAGGVGREGGNIRVRLPGFAPLQGSRHDISRSCAGALGKGRYGFCRRGGGSLPGPSPGDIPTVRCMGCAWDDAGEEQDRGQGISRLLPPPGAGEERRRCGRGGGERRAVSGFAFPGLRPSWDLATISPAPGRGSRGRASMVFIDGEGAPSPGDLFHDPVYGMTPVEGRIRAGTPGRPFWGYRLHCPPPMGGRGERCMGSCRRATGPTLPVL